MGIVANSKSAALSLAVRSWEVWLLSMVLRVILLGDLQGFVNIWIRTARENTLGLMLRNTCLIFRSTLSVFRALVTSCRSPEHTYLNKESCILHILMWEKYTTPIPFRDFF